MAWAATVRIGGKLTKRPSAIFRRHVRVVPYPEDDIPAIVAGMGYDDCLVMGSDYPHAEGLASPPTSSNFSTRSTMPPSGGSCATTPISCSPGADSGMADLDSADVDLDLLRASAREFLAGRGQKGSVKCLAAMDWTGLLVDEVMGGAGWRPVETCVVAEELGRAQDGSAWFGTTMAAAALASAPDEIRKQLLPGLLSGIATAGFAVVDDSARVIRGDEVDIVLLTGHNGIHLLRDLDPARLRLDGDLLDVIERYGVSISRTRPAP